jgi:murein DD-endopeptidase MepM/ murein hydrolase activator NlpD
MVLVRAGGFVQDPPLSVAPETLDPANTKPEEDQVKQLTTPATPNRAWSGFFRVPVDEPVCIKSWYGNRRSYNGSDFTYFHTGVDYGVCANLNVYAPAPGVVIFAGPLTVRGNSVIIDHGWGVYSGFYHHAELKVNIGDRVEAGTLIGLIGGTGRVTGPHLHWDLFVNGVQVQPLDWLETAYP